MTQSVTILEQTQFDGSVVEIVVIDKENGEYTTMPKSIYDEQQAEQSTLGLVNSDKPAEPVV